MFSDLIPPVIIGGTGGSGTRLVQTILEHLGFYMGNNLNESKDAMVFEPFLDTFINPILRITQSVNYNLTDLPSELSQSCMKRFKLALEQHIADNSDNNMYWGWKNPRSIYILPIIKAFIPQMKFIHLLRDGRDMALSKNQNQPRKHYEAMFGVPYKDRSMLHSIQLWEKVNTSAAAWASQNIKTNYLLLRYEDLCGQPQNTVMKLLDFLTIPPEEVEGADILASIRNTSNNIGRYASLTGAQLDTVQSAGVVGLTQFSYKVFP